MCVCVCLHMCIRVRYTSVYILWNTSTGSRCLEILSRRDPIVRRPKKKKRNFFHILFLNIIVIRVYVLQAYTHLYITQVYKHYTGFDTSKVLSLSFVENHNLSTINPRVFSKNTQTWNNFSVSIHITRNLNISKRIFRFKTVMCNDIYLYIDFKFCCN